MVPAAHSRSAPTTQVPLTGLNNPTGITLDGSGNIYVTDLNGTVIKLLVNTGALSSPLIGSSLTTTTHQHGQLELTISALTFANGASSAFTKPTPAPDRLRRAVAAPSPSHTPIQRGRRRTRSRLRAMRSPPAGSRSNSATRVLLRDAPRAHHSTITAKQTSRALHEHGSSVIVTTLVFCAGTAAISKARQRGLTSNPCGNPGRVSVLNRRTGSRMALRQGRLKFIFSHAGYIGLHGEKAHLQIAPSARPPAKPR